MDWYKIETNSTITIKITATTIDTLTNKIKRKDEIIKSLECKCALYDKSRKDVIRECNPTVPDDVGEMLKTIRLENENVAASEMEKLILENLQLSDD